MGSYLWEDLAPLQDDCDLCTFAPKCVVEEQLCNLLMQVTRISHSSRTSCFLGGKVHRLQQLDSVRYFEIMQPALLQWGLVWECSHGTLLGHGSTHSVGASILEYGAKRLESPLLVRSGAFLFFCLKLS